MYATIVICNASTPRLYLSECCPRERGVWFHQIGIAYLQGSHGSFFLSSGIIFLIAATADPKFISPCMLLLRLNIITIIIMMWIGYLPCATCSQVALPGARVLKSESWDAKSEALRSPLSVGCCRLPRSNAQPLGFLSP